NIRLDREHLLLELLVKLGCLLRRDLLGLASNRNRLGVPLTPTHTLDTKVLDGLFNATVVDDCRLLHLGICEGSWSLDQSVRPLESELRSSEVLIPDRDPIKAHRVEGVVLLI